jgi:serine/threonine-protein kinase
MTISSDAEFVGLQSILRGRYSLERRIGRGGMGEVFLARDLALDRAVAIKLLPLAFSSDVRARERFLREARTAAKLSHPHIVPIHSVEEHEDFVFFAMAYVDGETLADRVRRGGPIGAADATRILREVAWALAYAHQLGVVHRDIKPENILLEHGSGRAMVGDFGIARVRGSNLTGNVGEILGTLHYMSPEQISGAPLDGRSDLYSLGVTVFYALTTRLPYPATTAPVSADHLAQTTPSIALLRPDIPRAFAEAIDRCLAPEPDHRFASGEELAASIGEQPASVEVPMVLRRYAGSLQALGQDLMTYLALTAAIIITVWEATDIGHRIAEPLAAIMPTLVTMATFMLVLRFSRVVTRARGVLAASLRFEDARAILPGGAQATLHSTGDRPRRRRVARTIATVAILAAIGVAWHFAFRFVMARAETVGGYTAVGIVTAVLIVVARQIFANVIFRPRAPGLWNELWRGRFGRSVFDLAAIRLSRSRVAASVRAPEVVLGSAVRTLIGELDSATQRRLASTTASVQRIEDECSELRARGRQLDQLLRDTASTSEIKQTADLAERRRGVSDEINEARAASDARLSQRIAQLESVRLELLRLRAGLGDLDGILSRLEHLDRESGDLASSQLPAVTGVTAA